MPYYRKEGESWIPLEPLPPDIRVGRGKAHVFLNPEDEEQIIVYLSGNVIAREEDGAVIFPGQTDKQGRGYLINRRDVIFEDVTTGDRAMVIHSEKPIGEGGIFDRFEIGSTLTEEGRKRLAELT